MSMNADPNASFSLSTWILKQIRLYLPASTNSDRKSPNALIKSVWCPGGLYTVASTNIKWDLSLIFFLWIMLYETPLLQISYT